MLSATPVCKEEKRTEMEEVDISEQDSHSDPGLSELPLFPSKLLEF